MRAAAVAVLRLDPGVAAAVERLEAAERELVDAGDHVLWLAGNDVIDIRTTPEGGWRDGAVDLQQRARRAARRLETAPISWAELIRDKPGTASWEAALAALVRGDE